LASATLRRHLRGSWRRSCEVSQLMSRVPRWRDCNWLHFPRAPGQPAESVSAVLRNPPKA
jgi:hypothetical protein